MCRWQRLKDYADFRLNKLRLLHLPDDVFEHICMHYLTPQDLCALMTAVYGHMQPLHVMHIPLNVRCRWILSTVVRDIETSFHSFMDRCMFVATKCSHVSAFLDWSPFQKTGFMSCPVVTYSWNSTAPHARVDINYISLLIALKSSFRRHRPCGYLAFYTCMQTDWGPIFMDSLPAFSTSLTLFPPWVSPCMSLDFYKAMNKELHDTRRLCQRV